MDPREKDAILERYRRRSSEFEAVALRRRQSRGEPAEEEPLPETGPGKPLTASGRRILALIAAGDSNAEIARHLGIGVETVKTHVARLLVALGARNRAHAVAIGYDTGILPARARRSREHGRGNGRRGAEQAPARRRSPPALAGRRGGAGRC